MKRNKIRIIFFTTAFLFICLFLYIFFRDNGDIKNDSSYYRKYKYAVINEYPHDTNAFTQGLVYKEGFLYEVTGLKGESAIRKINLETGEVLQIRDIEDEYFGEGIAIYEDKLIQLTWKSGKGFVYDLETFNLLDEFKYTTEGWGITSSEDYFIMSDGTSALYFLDPSNYDVVRELEVYGENGTVDNLNELEYINGEIYSNVWMTDTIVIINPENGELTGKIDLSELTDRLDNKNDIDVLNGIAYDVNNDRVFVTGKLWPKIFEIELIPFDN